MATSNGLEEFAERMVKLGAHSLQSADRILRKAALVADQVAVTATPIDTGRARANWIVSIGSPDSGTVEESKSGERGSEARGAANAQIAINQAQTVLGIGISASGRDSKGRFTSKVPEIFIANNLPYIVPLDRGSSQQAPEGMTRAAVDAALKQIRRERFLGGFR